MDASHLWTVLGQYDLALKDLKEAVKASMVPLIQSRTLSRTPFVLIQILRILFRAHRPKASLSFSAHCVLPVAKATKLVAV